MRETANPEERTPIYYRKNYLESQYRLLENWTGSTANKEGIKGFVEYLASRGSGRVRMAKLLCLLRGLCNLAGKDLITLERRDIESLVAKINQHPTWTEHTKSDFRRAVKQFFKWYEEEDPRLNSGSLDDRERMRKLYKYISKEIRSKPRLQSIDYSNIITDDEARQLIQNGCKTTMERAMISLLHETGCRVGELLGIRLRDIDRKDHHAMIVVDGKTGQRRIPIIQSLPWLEQWIQDHPYRTNPDALLWISTHGGPYKGRPIRYYGVRRLLERVFAKAGIKKRHNPHWFRHSRSTIVAPKYSEAVLCKMLGWVPGSVQVRTYVHLGASQVEDSFLQLHGIKPDTDKTPPMHFCVCGTTNPGESRYCYKCGNPLAVATMLEDEERKKAAIDDDIMWFATTVMTNPELRKQFEELKAQRRRSQ